MAEIEGRTRSQGLHAEKADEKRRRTEPELGYAGEMAGGEDIFASLLADPGMELPVDRHAAMFGDARFSHPANMSQRTRMVSQLQRDYGNAYVQRIMRRTESGIQHDMTRGNTDSIIVITRQPASVATIARSPGVATEEEELEALIEQAAPGELNLEEIIEAQGETTPLQEAEFRAGTPSVEWPTLQPAQRVEIRNLISTGRRQEAVDRLWEMLPAAQLPEKGRVSPSPTVTNTLGMVEGELVFPGGAVDSGLAIPYVLATSACAGCPEAEHWQRHNAGELRSMIQIHNRVFERSAAEAVGQLLSTVMHEYTHVEQMTDEGLHEGIAFASYPPGSRAAVGEREYLTFAPEVVPPAERRRMEGLQEIDATCSEIENADRTGLTGLGLQGIVNYLWTSYQRYHSNLEGNPPDVNVEDRAYRNIVRGRQLFTVFLGQTTMYTAAQRQFLLDRCPENYDPSLMGGRPLTAAAGGEQPETESE